MGVYSKLRGFALAHRGGGELHGGAGPHTPDGYRPWARCSCGARSCGSTKPCDEPMAVHVLELMSLAPLLVRQHRQPLYFSSYTQPSRWKGWAMSVGAIGVMRGSGGRSMLQVPLSSRLTVSRRAWMSNGLPSTGTCAVLRKSSYGPASA